MPTSGILRVGQVDPNTYFVYLTQSGSLTSFDFSTVSAASIYVRKPSGALQTWSCTLSNQTATGLTATRTLQTGDLDEAGAYKGYVLMTVPGGTIRSDTETFYVAEEFAVVAAQDAPSWFISGAVISGGGGSTPTGTGFYGVTGGVMDAAAIKVDLASATYVTGTLALGNGGTGSTDYRSATETLTNKSIDADANTITNIDNADIKAGAAIAVSKLAPGTDTYVLTTTAGTAVWAAPSGGSVPTGTGFFTVTGGIMDAAAKSAATGIYTWLATPSSANLAAAMTDETGSGSLVFGTSPTLTTPVISSIVNTGTLTLPTTTDTLVGRATTDTLTNKTINGSSNTITNVSLTSGVTGTLPVANGGTGITSFGSGIATWLGTPSSANLRTALTDETGSGEAVFSTTPTFKTSVKVNNPANTFAYTLTPAAIAANRTLTLPLLTGNDVFVTEAFAQTLTNKTIDASSNTISNIVNANVNASAAIAGTKISPDFGSQNVLTTGYYATGSTVASTGNLRLGNTHKGVARNNGNSADACLFQYGSGDIAYYGLNSGFTEQAYGFIAGASQYMYLAVASTYYIHLEASEVRMGNPVVGDDTPYACHGAVVSSHTDANYTVPAAEYKYFTITFSTALSADRTMTFPHPSSLARSYVKCIRNVGTGVSITISTGTGTTIQVTNNRGILLEFTNGGVRVMGAEYTL